MRKLWQIAILGYLAGVATTTVWGQSLGLNFGANDPNPATSALLPGDVAGVVRQANWNNLEGATGSNPSPLVYDNGTGTAVPSTLSVDWSTTNTWRSGANNAFTAPGDRKLMSGYLDIDVIPQLITVNVNNIDAALMTPTYDVYVYFTRDGANNYGGGYTLTPAGGTPVVKYGSTMGMPTVHVEDPGTDINNSIDGTYLRFTGLTASSFTLVADESLTTPAGVRAPINAIQIVRGGLIAGDVNGDGQVNMADFDIIRMNLFKTGQIRSQGDLVGGDGVVDFADFREWKNRAPAGLAASASLSGSIPEPDAAGLLAIGVTLAAIARRRSERANSRSAL
jgi:hypothetical protein